MLNVPKKNIDFSALTQPVLCIVIDTEEEFNWSAPFSRQNTQVKNIAQQEKAQKIFAKYQIKPTYVIDYPVASQIEGIKPLKELFDANQCEIGSHLHPWVNPPYTEEVNNRNSFPGNLNYEQEFEKLKLLTQTISDNFCVKPTIYKAGRYGVGENTTQILQQLGYTIDCSVVPNTDFRSNEGPNFSPLPISPYRFAENLLLEVPLSVDYVGLLSQSGNRLYNAITQKPLQKLKIPGIFSKLGLLERIRLTPEGHTFEELKRLTFSMLKHNHNVFCLTYHSSTLKPGGSPYVNNASELDAFLHTLEEYCAFFTSEIHGTGINLTQINDILHH